MTTNDRNYYRMLDTEELIDIARQSKDELAIVLGERLLKKQRQLEAQHYDRKADEG
jgi:hypothetical protein